MGIVNNNNKPIVVLPLRGEKGGRAIINNVRHPLFLINVPPNLLQIRAMRKRLKKRAARKRAEMCMSLKKLVKNLRWMSIVLGVNNVGVIAIGSSLFVCGHGRSCSRSQVLPFLLVMVAAGVRVMAMIRCAIEQQAAAIAVLGSSPDASIVSDNLSRVQRRVCLKILLPTFFDF